MSAVSRGFSRFEGIFTGAHEWAMFLPPPPDNQGTAFFSFFFGGRSQLVVELDDLCEVNNLYSTQVGMIYHVVFMVRHPRGSYMVLPLLSLEVPTPEIKSTH